MVEDSPFTLKHLWNAHNSVTSSTYRCTLMFPIGSNMLAEEVAGLISARYNNEYMNIVFIGPERFLF
jgi:hypothetical protein